jgi:hypothetical protein
VPVTAFEPSPGGAAAASLITKLLLGDSNSAQSATIAQLLGEVRAGRPQESGHPDAVACLAAELAGATHFPELGAGDAAENLAAFHNALGGMSNADGAPLASPALVARAAWCAAHAVQMVPTMAPSVQADLIAIAHALSRFGGEMGWLPGPAEVQGFNKDPANAASRVLGVDTTETALEIEKDWRAWSWRSSGITVAHCRIQDEPSRVWVNATHCAFQWDWGAQTIVHASLEPGPSPAILTRARVDAPSFVAAFNTGTTERTLTARKARIIVRDQLTVPTTIRWNIAKDWTLAPDAKGYIATRGEHSLIIKLDSEWRWRLDGSTIVGTGTTERLRCSFELR